MKPCDLESTTPVPDGRDRCAIPFPQTGKRRLSVACFITLLGFLLTHSVTARAASHQPRTTGANEMLLIIAALSVMIILLLAVIFYYRRERKKLQNQICLLQSLGRFSGEKLAVTDKQGRYLYINPVYENLMGFKNSDVLNKTAADVLNKDFAETTKSHDQKVIDSETEIEQKEFFWSDSGLATYLTRKFPVYDNNGRFVAIGSVGNKTGLENKIDNGGFKSKDVLIRLINQIPALIILKDKSGRYMLVNDTVCKWHDTSRKACIGRTATELYPDQRGREIKRDDQKVLITETMIEREFEFTFADGLRRTVISNRFPVYNNEGVLIGTGFVATDITHLRKAERTAQQIIRAIEQISDPVAFYDHKGKLVFANTIYRTPVKEIRKKIRIGTTFESNLRAFLEHGFIDRKNFDKENFIFEQISAPQSSSASFEIGFDTGHNYRFRRKRLKDGGILVFGIDISSLKEIQKSLENSEKRFRDFTQAANDWFWETNEDYQFTVLSPRFEKVLEKSDNPEDTTLRPIRHLLERKKAFRDYIYSPSNDDNSYWRTSAVPVFDDKNIFCGFRGTTNDVTEEITAHIELENHKTFLELEIANRTEEVSQKARALEKSLQKEKEYSQLQKQFISMISHEYRTPLTVIDGVSQRLIRMKNKLTPEDITERARTIRSSVQKMIEMIDITLSTSKVDEGKVKLILVDLDLKSLLGEIINSHRELSPKHTFHIDTENLNGTIRADKRMIEQVFNNLFSNAVKYSPDDTDIEITGQQFDDRVEISVSDHGIGITENEIDKIFTRFFRAGTAKGISGTGLGLHLCKTFVELHHGKISLTSKEDEGTTFCVSLPLTQPEQNP